MRARAFALPRLHCLDACARFFQLLFHLLPLVIVRPLHDPKDTNEDHDQDQNVKGDRKFWGNHRQSLVTACVVQERGRETLQQSKQLLPCLLANCLERAHALANGHETELPTGTAVR